MSQYTPKPSPPLSLAAGREIAAIQALPYGLRGMRRFAKLLGFKIWPFQALMLKLYFGGVTELVILIPKKNGKTTLLAVLALYHLLMTPKAECVIGASSRDQATILFNQASALVVAAGLEAVFEVKGGYRIIKHDTGRIRVLAADANTADGVIPTLALVDELHRHPSGALYGVFRDGLLGSAQMITISTAGADMESPLGKLLDKARELAVEQVVKRRTYTSADGSFALIEWALDAGDDPDELALVKKANPAPWQTRGLLRRRHDSPSMTRGQWLRFACGIWTAGEEPTITPELWDAGRVDIGRVEDGEEVVMVPSLGHNAAVAIAARRPDDRVAVRVEHIEPSEGRSIQMLTEDVLVALCDRYHVAAVHTPRAGFLRSAELLEARGVPIIESPQAPVRLVEWSGTLNRLLKSGKLLHDGDANTRSQMLAAVVRTTETGERYLPADRSRAVTAVAGAVHAITAWEPDGDVILPSGVG